MDSDTQTDGAITLTVNGEAVRIEAAPETPLLYALRNDLGLTGARFGCGAGQCGSCMVLIDGRPQPSCDVPLWAAAGKVVETVESLSAGGVHHPLVRAFLAEQAGQCAYCISGILMSAKALLASHPAPSREMIASALDRHLCRCGSHQRIVRAVELAAHMAAQEGRP